MKTDLRLPRNFEPYGDRPIISNLEKMIDYDMAEKIKLRPYSSQYTAWDYTGSVWFNDELGYWCVEIWKFRQYEVIHLCESLEELFDEVREAHGYN